MDPMIWVIDDDTSIRFVFDKALQVNHMSHRLFENAESALEALHDQVPDVIVSDIRMPGIDGLTLIRKVHAVDPQVPFIIITAHSDLRAAVEAYEHGSFEYLPKPFDIEQAIALIRRAAAHRLNTLSGKYQTTDTGLNISDTAEIIGKSPAMQEVFKFIGRVAKTDVPVLIHGEPGTGRGLVARALHNHSRRSAAPFVPVSMSALPQELIERELFSDPGSGASSAFAQAGDGSIFINEISDMPPDAQTRLLHILQSGEYFPMGGGQPVSCHTRIIASSSKNLGALVDQGLFISDLYYRLNIINISMPPLRERSNDIPMLARHFLAQSAAESHAEPKKLTSEVLVFLCRQPWPGNVRQLKNLCKYLTIMVTGRDIQLGDLPAEFLNEQPAAVPAEDVAAGAAATWQELLRRWADSRLQAGECNLLAEATPQFERIMLEAALSFTGNHKQESARLLGWGRNTLTRKLRELGIR